MPATPQQDHQPLFEMICILDFQWNKPASYQCAKWDRLRIETVCVCRCAVHSQLYRHQYFIKSRLVFVWTLWLQMLFSLEFFWGSFCLLQAYMSTAQFLCAWAGRNWVGGLYLRRGKGRFREEFLQLFQYVTKVIQIPGEWEGKLQCCSALQPTGDVTQVTSGKEGKHHSCISGRCRLWPPLSKGFLAVGSKQGWLLHFRPEVNP